MLEKFREFHFRFGIMACSNDKELTAAQQIVSEHGAKILGKHSLRRKILIKSMIPACYTPFITEYVVYGAKNLTEALVMNEEFLIATRGFTIYEASFLKDC